MNETWNQRYKRYLNLVKTGKKVNLLIVKEELESRQLGRLDKRLSFGEEKLLQNVRQMLTEVNLPDNVIRFMKK